MKGLKYLIESVKRTETADFEWVTEVSPEGVSSTAFEPSNRRYGIAPK